MQNNKIKKLSDNIFQFIKKDFKKSTGKKYKNLNALPSSMRGATKHTKFFREGQWRDITKTNFDSSSPTIEDINQSFEYDRDGASLPVFPSELYSNSEQVQLLSLK